MTSPFPTLHRYFPARVFLAVVATLLFFAGPCGATNILMLHSYHQGYPWADSIKEGMKEVLKRQFPEATLFVEDMDSKRHLHGEVFPRMRRMLAAKYIKTNLDIILCSDDNALDFLLEYRDELFPGVPIVFCGINDFSATRLAGHTGITGVTENHDLKGTLELALRLHPQTTSIAVISDVTRTGRAMLKELREIKSSFLNRVEFLELAEMPAAQLKKALAKLPRHTVVLNLSYFRDPHGLIFTVQQSNMLITENSLCPVYVPWDFLVQGGVFGGRVVSGGRQGRNAAQLAVRILNGENPDRILPRTDIPCLSMFDHPTLQRFKIKPRKLPQDSVLLNHAGDRKNKQQTIIALSLALLFFGLTCGLGLSLLRHRETLKALQLSEQRFKAMLLSIGEAIHIKDRELTILWANDIAKKRFGENMIGQKCCMVLHNSSTPCSEGCNALAAYSDGETHTTEQVLSDVTGKLSHFLSTTTIASRDSNGEPETAITITRDITELKTIQQQYLLAKWAIDASVTPMIMTDLEGRITYVNQAALSLWQYPSEADMLEKSFSDLQKSPKQLKEIFTKLENRGRWNGEDMGLKRDGTCFDMELQAQLIRSQDGKPLSTMLSAIDVSDKKRAEAEIEQLAYFDTLTGLPNRSLFKNFTDQALGSAQRYEKIVAMLLLDLDNFKHINDSLGHGAGDLLLQAVAARVKNTIRSSDILGRWGGDEFVLLLTDFNDVRHVPLVADKILRSLNETPFNINGAEIVSSASIGIALYPLDGQDMETLLKHADAAMYEAKKKGRNDFCFFSTQLAEQNIQRVRMEINLHRALKDEEFHLVYQPQIDLDQGKVTGVETLVRWECPTEGNISPTRFIPLAEETGQIHTLGEWILRTACREAALWQQFNSSAPTLAVNFSVRQFFQPNLVSRIQKILEETGLPSQRLELELTESVFLENMDMVISNIQALKDLGIRVAIDDFGTGYSSLTYLKNLPIDRIKIAQEFVRDIETDESNRAIIKATIAMAKSLGTEVIAEGVETQQQLSFLLSQGCQLIQGYYFAKPMLAKDLPDYFSSGFNSNIGQHRHPSPIRPGKTSRKHQPA